MYLAKVGVELVERCVMSISLLTPSLCKILPHVKHFVPYAFHQVWGILYVVTTDIDDVLVRVAIRCMPAFVVSVPRD